MHETAYLNPSLTIIYEDRRGSEPEKITYHEPDGILGFIKELNEKKEIIHEPVYFKGEAEALRWKPPFSMFHQEDNIHLLDLRLLKNNRLSILNRRFRLWPYSFLSASDLP